MHHWQSAAENMDPGEPAPLKDRHAPIAFQKSEPQKHDYERTKFERLGYEFIGELERRIGNDGVGGATRSNRKSTPALLSGQPQALRSVATTVCPASRSTRTIDPGPQHGSQIRCGNCSTRNRARAATDGVS
jgi:hypothetical protein